ncbi:MAG: tRNA (adenosine(37)-N6)-dimethylallyltransferase MiaA, partial [Proteobacteria bacterium]|nr:tRNA (adenosine(37)-N6)-dimethylallyltransferase MiaA [Pseudomonadota bacterium]
MPAPLVVLAGPTAVGKTGLSLELARRFSAEIVGADSVQIYRGLDIGSAKPTPAEQAQARHHLIDVADPAENFSAARYAR